MLLRVLDDFARFLAVELSELGYGCVHLFAVAPAFPSSLLLRVTFAGALLASACHAREKFRFRFASEGPRVGPLFCVLLLRRCAFGLSCVFRVGAFGLPAAFRHAFEKGLLLCAGELR